MYIKRYVREAATIVKLRNHGYSMNMIARAFGRSTSIIWRILHRNLRILGPRGIFMRDLRKSPYTMRIYNSRRRWEMLLKYLPAWEKWAFGEGEKPP